MYVRWREKREPGTGQVVLRADLVESYRRSGQVRVGLVAYLGSIQSHFTSPDYGRSWDVAAECRVRFWLRALGVVVRQQRSGWPGEGNAAIEQAIIDAACAVAPSLAARVPMPQSHELAYWVGNLRLEGGSLCEEQDERSARSPRAHKLACRERNGLWVLQRMHS